jgi:hypothetical protein
MSSIQSSANPPSANPPSEKPPAKPPSTKPPSENSKYKTEELLNALTNNSTQRKAKK